MPGIQVIQDNSLDHTQDMFRQVGNLANSISDYKKGEIQQEQMRRELQAKKDREEQRKIFAQRMEQSGKVFSNPNATLEERMAAYQPVVDYQTKTGEDVSKQYGLYADDLKARMEGREKRNLEDYKLQGDIYQQDRKFAQESQLVDKKFSNDKSLAVMEMNSKRELAKLDKTLSKEKDAVANTDKLRVEFQGSDTYKNMQKVNTAYKNSLASLSKATGPGDIAAIFDFFKVKDPNSTVREGEFKSAAMSTGLVDRVNGWLTKTQNGKFLSDRAREEFADLMTDAYSEQYNSFNKVKAGYEKIADKRGLAKDEIFTSEFDAPKSAKEALSAAREETMKGQKQQLKFISPADQKELQARPEVQERIKKFAIANADKLNQMDENQRAEVMRNLFEKIVRTQGYTIKADNVAGN